MRLTLVVPGRRAGLREPNRSPLSSDSWASCSCQGWGRGSQMSASSWLLPSLTLGQSEVARSQGLSALSQLPQGSVLQCSGVSLLENRPGPLPTGTVSVGTSRVKSGKCVCVCVCARALEPLCEVMCRCVCVELWWWGVLSGAACLAVHMHVVNPPIEAGAAGPPLRW